MPLEKKKTRQEWYNKKKGIIPPSNSPTKSTSVADLQATLEFLVQGDQKNKYLELLKNKEKELQKGLYAHMQSYEAIKLATASKNQ